MSGISPRRRPRAQRGLSLVELLVGITVGLFIVAAASMLMANQLSDNRRLLLETQLQQDLRATLDIVVRQLRRSGSEVRASAGQGLLAFSTGAGGTPQSYTDVSPSTGTANSAAISFYLDQLNQGPFVYQLNGGIVQVRYGAGGWQDLTDGNTMVVTDLQFTPTNVESAPLPCAKTCPGPAGPTACWPTVIQRSFVVSITARARNGTSSGDPTTERTMQAAVRLRNDFVHFRDSANPNLACPA
jgi:type IV pilus assembly protein PilW